MKASTKYRRLRIKTQEKIDLIGNFSTMLSSGIPILEAVETLKSDASGSAALILKVTSDDVSAGRHVYESLSKFPNVFDQLTVNFLKASEEAGTLETTLEDLHRKMEADQAFSDKVRGAMFYPMIVMVLFSVILIVLLLFVIPQIGEMFEKMPFPLPLPTKILIAVSNVMRGSSWLVLGGILGFVGTIFFLYSRFKETFFRLITGIPGLRSLVYKIEFARFAHSMNLLLTAGLPLTRSLELASPLLISPKMKKTAERVLKAALEGKMMAAGFKAKGTPVPSIIIKLIEVGERTGTLEASMQKVSDHMQYDVKRALDKFTVLLEPAMLVFVGLLVGGLMFAIMAPIYSIISQVNA